MSTTTRDNQRNSNLMNFHFYPTHLSFPDITALAINTVCVCLSVCVCYLLSLV